MTDMESLDVTLASQDEPTIKVCPYYMVGFCKFRSHCKHIHPTEDCGERKCGDKNCMKRHRKQCRFGKNCTRIETCEFLHQTKIRENTETLKLETQQKSLQELIKSKEKQILELSVKIEQLEITVKGLEEERNKVKSLEKIVKETEEKVSTIINGLEHMISQGFFRHYMQIGVPDKGDIKNLNTKIGVVLKELGFNHPCERCGEVFKTERQLKSHKKIHEEQDRREDEAEEERLKTIDE